MLKLYDTSRQFIAYLTRYKDYHIEYDLESADSLLYLTYLGKNALIRNECYIMTDSAYYVVKELRPSDEGVDVVCQLDLEDLEKTVFDQYTAEDCTVTEAANLALAGTGWTVSTDITKQRSIQTFRARPRQILEKIRDAFMCELKYDNIHKIVTFTEEFGSYRGVYFRRDLNLKKLSTTVDSYDYYTRIIPVGKDGLTIKSVNDNVEYLDNFQYSNKAKVYVWEDTNYDDASELKEDAAKKLEDLSKPKTSYSADIIDLAGRSHTYDLLSFELGDAVDIVDELSGVKDRQRIVKLTAYPDEPERNSCELSNTVLTFEELQSRLDKAADAWEDVTNSDGSIKGVYVHGVKADDVVYIETVHGEDVERSVQSKLTGVSDDVSAISARVGTIEASYVTTTYLTANYLTADEISADYLTAHDASITYATITSLRADEARIQTIETTYLTAATAAITYATIDLANIAAGTIKTAMIDTGAIGTAQIADGSVTDAKIVGLTASKITAGTIDAASIDVINLNAANITVGSINGTQIAGNTIGMNNLQLELGLLITEADENATEALGTARTRNRIYHLPSAPTDPDLIDGDTWFDTSDGYKMYRCQAGRILADENENILTDENGNQLFAHFWREERFSTSALAVAAVTTEILAAGSVTADKIVAGAITADKIAAKTITANEIATGTITTDEIATGAITAQKIQTGTITALQLASGAVTTDKLDAGAVTADKIESGTITADQIASGTITADRINVTDLFSENITATGTISGGTLTGTTIIGPSITTSPDGNGAKTRIDSTGIRFFDSENRVLSSFNCEQDVYGKRAGVITLKKFNPSYEDDDGNEFPPINSIIINGRSGKITFLDFTAAPEYERVTAYIDGPEGDAYFEDRVTAGEFVPGSDRRLKDKISDITDPNEFIASLIPRQYILRSKGDEKTHFGFIAQEVNKISDLYNLDICPVNKQTGMYGLNYTELIAPHIAVTQNHEKRIRELEMEIEKLRGLYA